MSQKNFLDKRGLTYFYDKINSSYLIKYQNMSTNKTDLAVIATKYDSTSTYNIGDYCVYQEKLYKCSVNIETTETWNEQHWTEVTISDELENIYNLFEDVLLKPQVSGIQGQVLTADGQGGQSWEDSIASGIAASDANEDGNIIINNTINVELDERPTEDSVNGVTSGGVYDALNDYVQKTNWASANDGGIVKVSGTYGIGMTNNTLYAVGAPTSQVKTGTESYRMINPNHQHEAAFYGLAKAAGDTTQSQSDNAVGTYTDEAKSAIKNMLDITDGGIEVSDPNNDGILVFEELGNLSNTGIIADTYSNITTYDVGDYCIYEKRLYKCTSEISTAEEWDSSHWTIVNVGDELVNIKNGTVQDIQVNGTSVVNDGVAEIPLATDNIAGVVKILSANGIRINSSGQLEINYPTDGQIKNGSAYFRPIVPALQEKSTFYGLAKAAGDTTQSASDNAVGTYTDAAKTAIRSMFGAAASSDIPTVPVTDVQIDGTSVLSNGIANIPKAGASTSGVIKVSNQGVGLNSRDVLQIVPASLNTVKEGTQNYNPIVPSHQHESTFYGLAKAAGDTTQSASDNVVGTYTDEAKTAIKSMLGVNDVVTDITVSGTTPTITAVANTRYICGEVSTLDFTPSSTGICDVVFTSGSTATVLTLPSTVKMPEWFDATSLEDDTIYEINIIDGIYGAVMSWQV